jgi:hypothetical protein
MIDEHMEALFHLVGPEVGDGDRRRWEATVVLPIGMAAWRDLEAAHPEGGEPLHRAAFELVRPNLAGVPTSVRFLKVSRIVVETVIGVVSGAKERTGISTTYWLTGEGPLDADALATRLPRATHAVARLRESGGRTILVHGFLHDYAPDDRRVDWEESRRPAEPSHRLLTVEGGFHPPTGAKVATRQDT